MKAIIFSIFLLTLSGGLTFATTVDFNKDYSGNKGNQGDQDINKKDDSGRKQGKWVFYGKDEPDKGYPETGKISEGPFLNDRKNGVWILYFPDGLTPKTKGNYVNNRPDGAFVKYYPSGKVKAEGTFNKRFYVDSLKRYNEAGVLVYEGNHNATGGETGNVKYFYDNGKPEFIYSAENGIPKGAATRYWPNGDIKEKIVYGADGKVQQTSGEIAPVKPMVKVQQSGSANTKLPPKPSNTGKDFEPDGYNKVFNKNKDLWIDGYFKNGNLWDGRLYLYDSDGLLEKVEIYKEGRYHSDGQLN